MVQTSLDITKDECIASFLEEKLKSNGCREKNIDDMCCALMLDRRINGKRRDSYIGRDEKIALQLEREINGAHRSNSIIGRDEIIALQLDREINGAERSNSIIGRDEKIALELEREINGVQRSNSSILQDEKFAEVLQQEMNVVSFPVDFSEDKEFARLLQQQLNNDSFPSPSGVDLSKDEELARAMDQKYIAIDPRCQSDRSSSGDVSTSDILSEELAQRTHQECRQSVAPAVVNSQKDDNRLIDFHQHFDLEKESARPDEEKAPNINEAFEKLLNRRRRKSCIFTRACPP